MKNTIFKLMLITFVCMSCSSGGDSDDGEGGVESKPTTPSLVFPGQDQLCTTNTLNFEWKASTNEDGSSVIYTLEIAKDNQFSNKIIDEVLTDLSKVVTLEKGFAYYWRVKSRSTKSIESDYSPISQFYTEEVPNSNHLPFAPSLINPFLGQTLEEGKTSVTLEWFASDVDKDPLTFDVYFGKNKDALNKIADNTSATTFEANLDSTATTYYWRIKVKDNKGAEVTGPLWYFKL